MQNKQGEPDVEMQELGAAVTTLHGRYKMLKCHWVLTTTSLVMLTVKIRVLLVIQTATPFHQLTQGVGRGTSQTLSSEESASDDEVQSIPSNQNPPQTPYPGMIFDSWEAAKLHYNKYAKHGV